MEPVLHHWGDRIAASGLSVWLSNREWLIAASQSVHIVMLSIVFGSAILINLRLLGVSSNGRPVSQLVRTLVPWMYVALLVLLITGMLQTIAEPVREFVAPMFWAKMLMVVIAVVLTQVFAQTVRRDPPRWDLRSARPRAAIAIAIGSLFLWAAIIVCGRFIGYTWYFYT